MKKNRPALLKAELIEMFPIDLIHALENKNHTNKIMVRSKVNEGKKMITKTSLIASAASLKISIAVLILAAKEAIKAVNNTEKIIIAHPMYFQYLT